MADGERHHLWADACLVHFDRRHDLGARHLCLDHSQHGSGSGHSIAERDLHSDCFDELLHGDRNGFRDGRQGDSDRIGMANGQRYHLRQDTCLVDADRRNSVRCRHFRMDHAHHGTRRGNRTAERDLHSDCLDELHHSDWLGFRDGSQGDSDGVGMADGQSHHLRADACLLDADRWNSVRCRHLCMDHARHGSGSGHSIAERDLHPDCVYKLQPSSRNGFRDGRPRYAGDYLYERKHGCLWHDADGSCDLDAGHADLHRSERHGHSDLKRQYADSNGRWHGDHHGQRRSNNQL